MFQLSRDFHINYSHTLIGVPPTHPCFRFRWHAAAVRVTMAVEQLDDNGFVFGGGDNLEPIQTHLTGLYQGKHLNSILSVNPTAENLAAILYGWCADRDWPVLFVAWSDTPDTWALHYPAT